MNNLFNVLLTTIKAKVTPIWTKLKYWTSWSFIRSRILTKIRELLSGLFSIRPRHKRDYFPILGFLVSKKLAFSVVIAVGICCLYYLFFLNPPSVFMEAGAGVRVYNYNSLPLRFANGEVRIKAKSGYTAYEGKVEDGYAAGLGSLYDENGALVYQGSFAGSMYQGEGVLYYPDGQPLYDGGFERNLFQGNGTLYRENGTRQYTGGFAGGEEEGTGTLFDAAETPVFSGEFHGGEPVYSQFLGKSAEEIAALYTGERLIYQMNGQNVVLMKDIDAFYLAGNTTESIDDSIKAEKLYVCSDSFAYGGRPLSTLRELNKALGNPVFEGYSYMSFPEAVGVSYLEETGVKTGVDPALTAKAPYEEIRQVTSFAADEPVYLYVYQKEGMTYSFIANDKNKGFFMYLLEK